MKKYGNNNLRSRTMKQNIFVVFVLVVTCTFFSSCDKNKGGNRIEVNEFKITNDIDSTFNVQAQMLGDNWNTGGGDLGIVGRIENGYLTISIPAPKEEMLNHPVDLDLGCNTDEMKIANLSVSTSNSIIILENFHSGEYVSIWFSNKDGDIDFYGVTVSLKKGWNFIEGASVRGNYEARTWTSLQDAYEEGSYNWALRD